MATDYTNVKALSQITLTDLTDSYSAQMTCDSYTFKGDTDSAVGDESKDTRIIVWQGIDMVPFTVSWDASALPAGLTISTPVTGTDGYSQIVTFSATSALTERSGSVELILTIDPNTSVTGDEITLYKTFSWAVALTGSTGAPGDDAIDIDLYSSNGIVFRNAKINTTLTAVVKKGGTVLGSTEVSDLGTLYWYKNDEGTLTRLSAYDGKESIEVALTDFVDVATYEVYLSSEGAPA